MVSQNSAENQFNLQKAGVQTNAANSAAQLQAGGYGTVASLIGNTANLFKNTATPTTITTPTTTAPATSVQPFTNTGLGLGNLNYSLLNSSYTPGAG